MAVPGHAVHEDAHEGRVVLGAAQARDAQAGAAAPAAVLAVTARALGREQAPAGGDLVGGGGGQRLGSRSGSSPATGTPVPRKRAARVERAHQGRDARRDASRSWV